MFEELRDNISSVVFPNACVVCGAEYPEEEFHICLHCRKHAFADANPKNRASASDAILPKGVIHQQALWTFDKGGVLQQLLHELKYHRLVPLGRELGIYLGHRIRNNPDCIEEIVRQKAVLVPVPLHAAKYRARGFNQARVIAEGVGKVLNVPVVEPGSVRRIKNTKTQTGFTMKKRLVNMQNAFTVHQPECIDDVLTIIVDDVFTTGSTSFELARTLLAAGAFSSMIVSIAIA